MPQVCVTPGPTEVQSESVPTRTGLSTFSVVPLPTSPFALSPQHQSDPEGRVPQTWSSLELTVAQALWNPTWRGRSWSLRLPVPSWPWSFAPQHHSVPVSCKAHVDNAPPVTNAQWERLTDTGSVRSTTDPSPS